MRMTLARKGILAHVQVVKDPAEMTEALGLIAQGVSVERHKKIRSAASAMHAWNTLLEFYNQTTMHNRVTMIRRLHEFKTDDGLTMARHLDKVDEPILGLQTLDNPFPPTDFELIALVVENSKDVTLIEPKEKLFKKSERQQKKETSARALKATSFDGYDRKSNNGRRLVGFKGKCFAYCQAGHMKRGRPKKVNDASNND
ncbi:polyprotein [Phytophthora megakarya]|uniref:Polyprotein n=1 Tax=Phytophthora megakarya TaxID=4795 RepID=A0A225WBX8_9STRA|nr:polyprotein [Phytophthora megakarya]